MWINSHTTANANLKRLLLDIQVISGYGLNYYGAKM